MREVCVRIHGFTGHTQARYHLGGYTSYFLFATIMGGEKRKTCLFLSDGWCGWYSNSTGVLSLLRHQDKKVIGKLLAAAAGVVGNQNLGHGNAFCTKFCYWFGDGF